MPEISLEAGSAAERAALHFRANPGLMMDRHGLAKLLGITPPMAESVLEPAVNQQLITIISDPELGRAWRAGPRLATWTAGCWTAPAVAKPPPAKVEQRGGVRRILPPLDLTKLKVSADLPRPQAAMKGKGLTRHDHIFDTLAKDGMSVSGIPRAYRGALNSAALSYLSARPKLKARCKLQVRTVDANTCGVWRVAIETA